VIGEWRQWRRCDAFDKVTKAVCVTGIKPVVMSGHPGSTIVEYAAAHEIDCIIIASHRPGLQDDFPGSNAGRVVRHAKCAVPVIPSGGRRRADWFRDWVGCGKLRRANLSFGHEVAEDNRRHILQTAKGMPAPDMANHGEDQVA
jgi:hypothetical protein